MLKRLYIHNFRMFQNFEIEFGRLTLLAGRNGSGKTSVIRAIQILRKLVGGATTQETFERKDMPWMEGARAEALEQQFEATVQLADQVYEYRIVVEYPVDSPHNRIKHESLSVSGKSLFRYELGLLQLERATGGDPIPFRRDWHLSALTFIEDDRPENAAIRTFKNWILQFQMAQPNPFLDESESDEESAQLEPDMRNFVAWYRHASQEEAGRLHGLFENLREVMPEFRALKVKKTGIHRRGLYASLMTHLGNGKGPIEFDATFSCLSEGQRCLIYLYSMLAFVVDKGGLCAFDEPEGFIALRELQPFLSQLRTRGEESNAQAIIVSHHPEVLNDLGLHEGILLWRDEGGPVRCKALEGKKILESGSTISEFFACGWEIDDA